MWKDLLLELVPKLLAGMGSTSRHEPARLEQPSQRNGDEMALARAVTAQETLVRRLETQLGEQREAVTELGQNMVRVRLAVRSLDGRLERMEKKESAMMRLILVLVVLLVVGLAGMGWFFWHSYQR